MNLVAVLHLVVAAVAIALAVPLILKKIPMNNWYGIRIPAAFESDARWYELNVFGGWVLLGWGLGIAAIAGVGLMLERKYWMHYTWGALIVILASLGFAALLILRRAGRESGGRTEADDSRVR